MIKLHIFYVEMITTIYAWIVFKIIYVSLHAGYAALSLRHDITLLP